MSFRIFPPIVEVYPNDALLFEALAEYPPPFWASAGPGVLQPDFSVRADTIAPTQANAGLSALDLVRGAGAIEWTLTQNCVPTGSGQFSVFAHFLIATGAGDTYEIRIKVSTIEVWHELSQIATLTHTAAVGDRFKIELANGFRLFVNDVLRNELTGVWTAISPPARYNAAVSGAMLSSPSIVPPFRLSGDWRLRRVNIAGSGPVFSIPHGTLTPTSPAGSQIKYSGGTVPGQYKLVAFLSSGQQRWFEDANLTGSTVTSSGGTWQFLGPGTVPVKQVGSGILAIFGPSAAAQHFYQMLGATDTLQINLDDNIIVHLFYPSTNPPQEMMVQFHVTDSTGWEHRAYWGANLIASGVNGTPSRWRIDNLPAADSWKRFEFPAKLLDLEGRVLDGLRFDLYDGEGAFDMVGRFPGKLQRAEATIVIPPLQILGELTRTFQPGQKARFQTNYDVAQTQPAVTWSVVSGGGSFSQGEFTAPTAPGTTIVRATASVGNQVADITINVPAVITPNFFAAAPLETIDWDTNIVSPAPTWTAVAVAGGSAGSINSTTGEWTAPSGVGQTVKITASNGTFSVTRDVLILEKFPFDNFALPLTVDYRKTVLISRAEDRTRTARVKDKDGKAFRSYEVRLTQRTVADLQAVIAFFDAHYPSKRFILEDKREGIRLIVYFDSDLRWEGNARCGIDISFRVIEA